MRQTGESPPDLTILILCRNEEGGIARSVGEAFGFLKRKGVAGEVVVVDNGSSDRSRERALRAGARVVHEPRTGYGNAVIGGIAAAKGAFIILGDGDGEHDLDALEPFWEKLQEGADFVIGNRYRGNAPPGSSVLRRRIGNPMLSGLGRLLFQAPVNDFLSGLRAFRADSARALGLRSPGMEMASEMIVKAWLRGMRFAEAPVSQRPALDPARSSHLRVWRDGWRHLRLLLALSPRRLSLFSPSGRGSDRASAFRDGPGGLAWRPPADRPARTRRGPIVEGSASRGRSPVSRPGGSMARPWQWRW